MLGGVFFHHEYPSIVDRQMLFSNLTVPCCFFSFSSFIRHRQRRNLSLIAKNPLSEIEVVVVQLAKYWSYYCLPTPFALSLLAHFHGEAISLSNKPESAINQKVVVSMRIRYQPIRYCLFTYKGWSVTLMSPTNPLSLFVSIVRICVFQGRP
jgi:hypothetical protein